VYNVKLSSGTHEYWKVRADGALPPEKIRTLPDTVWADPTDVTPDGKYLVAAMYTGGASDTDLFLFPLAGDAPPQKLLSTDADRTNGRFSPDGGMIAFTSNETGRAEVYVRPYPELDRQVRVSSQGGFRLSWATQGSRLAFRYGDSLDVVDVSREPTMIVSRPLVSLQDLPESRFDASPDGLNFLMAMPAGGSAPADRVELITGFEHEAREKLRRAQQR
jgi:dipeptidyl aminopeptidase/acylaminoacyl peptidase